MAIRWGLCCQFLDSPIRFRQATHRYVAGLAPETRRAYLNDIVRSNAIALAHAAERCTEIGIGAFRITSQLVPLATHPTTGFALHELDDLRDSPVLERALRAAGDVAAQRGVRLSFHPDQFVVLNSAREDVVRSSMIELEHMGRLAAIVGADTLCIHGGSTVDGRHAALDRLRRALDRLSPDARTRVALENDDRAYSPADLLPLCEAEQVPFIYDVHHHRCLPDGLTVDEVTKRAAATWSSSLVPREQWAHLSSPRLPWTEQGDHRPHADFVNPDDVPAAWHGFPITVDVEAKAKERAVLGIIAATSMANRSPNAHD